MVEVTDGGTDVTAPIVFTSDGRLKGGSLEKIVEWVSSKQHSSLAAKEVLHLFTVERLTNRVIYIYFI